MWYYKNMKNVQKGFIVPAILIVVALLAIGGGVYVYENKKAEVSTIVDTGTQQPNQQTNTQTSPVANQQNPTNTKTVNVEPQSKPGASLKISPESLSDGYVDVQKINSQNRYN